MKSSAENHAWNQVALGGLASFPSPAVDVLSVPGGLFNPSKDHQLSWPVQDFQIRDL